MMMMRIVQQEIPRLLPMMKMLTNYLQYFSIDFLKQQDLAEKQSTASHQLTNPELYQWSDVHYYSDTSSPYSQSYPKFDKVDHVNAANVRIEEQKEFFEEYDLNSSLTRVPTRLASAS